MSASVTPRTAAHQDSLLSDISWSSLKFTSTESVMQSNHLILCCPLLLSLQSFAAPGSFPMSRLFASGGQSSIASTSVLLMNIQGWFPCCPRDFQESSPAPQFKSIMYVLFQNTTLKWNVFNIQLNVLVLLNPNIFVMLWKNQNKTFWPILPYQP